MPKMLIRYALAAAIAGAGTPAWSAGIPDFGTKNFSPGSDAPAYFSNESGAFFGAAASENEDGNDVSSSSMLATAEPDYSVSKGPQSPQPSRLQRQVGVPGRRPRLLAARGERQEHAHHVR